ncbi:hypothetical protein X942_5901 [Burkholderia pseudomallei MSHR5596]|nr:hypothetical protein X942_5901 [Burkholderia pseudomallei MSHR5596]
MRDAWATRGQYRPLVCALRANSRLNVEGARLSLRAIARKLNPSSCQKSIRIRSSGCSCWYVLFAIRGLYRLARVLQFRFEAAPDKLAKKFAFLFDRFVNFMNSRRGRDGNQMCRMGSRQYVVAGRAVGRR